MKNLVLSCLLVSCIGFQSCKKNEKPDGAEVSKAETEKFVKIECYKAIYDSDTIDLKLNTLKDGKIIGNMTMKIEFASEKTGEIKGEFRGDTLFADYTFTQGKNKQIFKNPMAFLKRDKELILGNGAIETSMGVSYFVKNKPIDFDKVKYKFTNIDCDDE
ncbi:hypothetical protein [Flavobacterium piscis]|uniref:DUF4352 domain-containing protein n=1 Tax=Flavobacterium piscis TaxID=1114874 RepID=A0ABU1Y785_9FLAO|nr:hypothetical protein [Flavobacterium piscis]MDR7210089.1 hypothetical protein [Flavobacterium piscis]